MPQRYAYVFNNYFQKISESDIFSYTCIWFNLENPNGKKLDVHGDLDQGSVLDLDIFLWNLCQYYFHLHFFLHGGSI